LGLLLNAVLVNVQTLFDGGWRRRRGSQLRLQSAHLFGEHTVLLFQPVQAPSPRFALNVRIGTSEYPREEAADPSALAQKIRQQLTDERRAVRVYGSEVVICRLTADEGRARLHLVNYGGREIEGLLIRVRGVYGDGEALVSGAGRLALEDRVASGGVTEFTVPRITTYAVIDLRASR